MSEDEPVKEYADLIAIFEQTFFAKYNTKLVLGGSEPIYLPANKSDLGIDAQPYAQVVFAHGYFTSALHEIAHWCLAGMPRLNKIDYGYWYCPDGRTAEQQAKFQQAEVKPQAIEMAFSLACGIKFNVSCDNLSGDEFGRQPDHIAFEQDVARQFKAYLADRFPPRAELFIAALSQFYQQDIYGHQEALDIANRQTEVA